MVDWSYGLLDDDERQLFRSLGVFAGGFTVDAVEAVGGSGDKVKTLDLLNSLVRQSLVVADPAGARSRSESRDAAAVSLDRLDDAGESVAVAHRHARWCADFARSFDAGVVTPDEPFWLAQLDAEFDNLRAAVAFVLAAGDVELAVRLVSRLHGGAHTQRLEPMDWAREVLALPGADGEPDVGLVYLVITRGGVAWRGRRNQYLCRRACHAALVDDNARSVVQGTLAAVDGWRGEFLSAVDRLRPPCKETLPVPPDVDGSVLDVLPCRR